MSTNIVKWKALVVAIAVLSCGPEDYNGQAKTAVTAFHDALNRGAFEELYLSSDSELRDNLTREQFDSYLGFLTSTLGKAEATENVNTMAAVFTGRGWLVDARQKTRFANGPADEHFVWKRVNGQLHLLTYQVDSPLLVPKVQK